jgi:hypothetical protein
MTGNISVAFHRPPVRWVDLISDVLSFGRLRDGALVAAIRR